MNIKISIIIFILLSFLNMGAISNNFNEKDSLNVLETNMKSISEFEENGVKLQYRTKENIDKEIFRVRNYLTSRISGANDNSQKDQFTISNNDFKVDVKVWYEDRYSYVEVVLVNKNSNYTTKDLTSILHKLVNEKSENVQYFSYCDGKIYSSNYSIDKFINDNNLQNAKFLKIKNGYTGTGYLNNKSRINFALINYNTGSHIIIGTPIIFTTY